MRTYNFWAQYVIRVSRSNWSPPGSVARGHSFSRLQLVVVASQVLPGRGVALPQPSLFN
jgi:hypothetical protein